MKIFEICSLLYVGHSSLWDSLAGIEGVPFIGVRLYGYTYGDGALTYGYTYGANYRLKGQLYAYILIIAHHTVFTSANNARNNNECSISYFHLHIYQLLCQLLL